MFRLDLTLGWGQGQGQGQGEEEEQGGVMVYNYKSPQKIEGPGCLR